MSSNVNPLPLRSKEPLFRDVEGARTERRDGGGGTLRHTASAAVAAGGAAPPMPPPPRISNNRTTPTGFRRTCVTAQSGGSRAIPVPVSRRGLRAYHDGTLAHAEPNGYSVRVQDENYETLLSRADSACGVVFSFDGPG